MALLNRPGTKFQSQGQRDREVVVIFVVLGGEQSRGLCALYKDCTQKAAICMSVPTSGLGHCIVIVLSTILPR